MCSAADTVYIVCEHLAKGMGVDAANIPGSGFVKGLMNVSDTWQLWHHADIMKPYITKRCLHTYGGSM
jgi:hypothetical protein